MHISGGSSAEHDHQWIRLELHRWVYANVRAKWRSVTRADKARERLLALFSGYQAPRCEP